jgi:murein DD-endopeptidase MepM/ murein hydrolase activator NlpD
VDRPRSASVPAPRAAADRSWDDLWDDTAAGDLRSDSWTDGAPAAPPAPLPAPAPAAAAETPAVTRTRPRRSPPGRRAPLLLAAAVLGALLTTLATSFAGPDTPVASGSQYGLGIDSEVSFSGGVDASARSEVSQAEAQARISQLAASRAARAPQFVIPTTNYHLSTCYCMRWGTMHWGIDLAAPLGTPIYAAADGVVLRAGPATGFGNAIYIQDADGNVEIYGHMRYYNVKAGDVVSAGDQIAKVGSQGQSTGPHLHFEIHVGGMNGKPTDPSVWLSARGLTVG